LAHALFIERERERWEETGRNYIGFNHLNYLSTDIGGFNETNGCGYFIDSMEAGVLKYKENPWYHFVLTYDEGNIIFYANGVNVSKVFSVEENASGNLLLFGVEDYSRVSAISAWGGRMDYFDGWMDEVAFYDRVLSPDEVKMLSGSFYDNFDIPVIFSRYPEEGYHVFNNSINFSCDILDNGNNLINISLYSNIYGEFSVLKSKDISGGKEDIIFELNVSDVKDGNYEWAFVAFDSFGNSNVADYYMLKVRNDDIYSIDKIKAKEGSLVCIFEDFAVYLRNIINNCLEKIK